jgi:glycosyltransferase involved in cell wall biosynthesis
VSASSPTISVIVPTFARNKLLGRCLASIVECERDDLEVLVGDNNPGFGARPVVDELGDLRIRYIGNERNIGPIQNIYNLLCAATGEWIFCITDDDVILPGGLEKVLEVVRAEPDVGIIMSALRCCDESGNFLQVYQTSSIAGKLAAGTTALRHLVPAAHVLSAIVFRKRWAELEEMRRHFDSLYPQMFLVGGILKNHPGFYINETIVAHTQGNRVYWSYSDDYMFNSRLQLVYDLLPGERWRRERSDLRRQLIEEVARAHVPHAFAQSLSHGVRHQLLILRNMHVVCSRHYWFALTGALLSALLRRLSRGRTRNDRT